jgi:hypothetical protein
MSTAKTLDWTERGEQLPSNDSEDDRIGSSTACRLETWEVTVVGGAGGWPRGGVLPWCVFVRIESGIAEKERNRIEGFPRPTDLI